MKSNNNCSVLHCYLAGKLLLPIFFFPLCYNTIHIEIYNITFWKAMCANKNYESAFLVSLKCYIFTQYPKVISFFFWVYSKAFDAHTAKALSAQIHFNISLSVVAHANFKTCFVDLGISDRLSSLYLVSRQIIVPMVSIACLKENGYISHKLIYPSIQ